MEPLPNRLSHTSAARHLKGKNLKSALQEEKVQFLTVPGISQHTKIGSACRELKQEV
jgi:hypothetical protein